MNTNQTPPAVPKTDNVQFQAGAAALVERLRATCQSIRSRSAPLADLIPLMQQAADALEAAARAAPAPQNVQTLAAAPRAQAAPVVAGTDMPSEVWDLIHEWRDTLDNERADWIENRVNELWRLGHPPESALSEALEEFDHRLSGWAKAYPLSVFPEPDLAKVRTVLEKEGMTLDAVSASNMRHVTSKLNELFDPVRAAAAIAAPGQATSSERPASPTD